MSQTKTEDQYNAIDWFKKGLSNYANFSGRARRKEYWFFVLVQFGVLIIAAIIDSILFKKPSVLYFICALALIIPSISIAVRRLHDTDRTGWWYLIALIPFGAFVLIYWLALDTKPEANQWGNPAK
jgi:uncharacterized membrane protein YhaH (DUF805 family)